MVPRVGVLMRMNAQPTLQGGGPDLVPMAKSSDINVLLVKAGPTTWDEADRVAGATDLPLSDIGRAAIPLHLRLLEGIRLATVLTGPDEASIEIGKAIAEGAGGRHRTIDELHEIRLGLWEGCLRSELAEKHPKTMRQWNEDPASVNVPQGETLAEAEDRVLAELGRILEKSRSDDRVAIVLRPVVMGLLRCWMEGHPGQKLWTLIAQSPDAEWRCISRGALREMRERERSRAKA